MHRAIAAFLVLLTLLLPALGSAAGVRAAAPAPACALVIDEAVVSFVDATQESEGSQDSAPAATTGALDLADGPGDMPVLLDSPRSPAVVRVMSDALPSVLQGDAPSPFLEGLRRPPRGVSFSR